MQFAGTLEEISCAHAANMTFRGEIRTKDATSALLTAIAIKGNRLLHCYNIHQLYNLYATL